MRGKIRSKALKIQKISQEKVVEIGGGVMLGNRRPFVFIGGVNVLESEEVTFRVAERLCDATRVLGIPIIFKASYDKANRTSIDSYRGPAFDSALETFRRLKRQFAIPIVTDVHEPAQAKAAAQVVDVLQIPAMLSRQTDLIRAACETKRPVLIKKMQTMAPAEAGFILEKCRRFGNEQVILCERGTMFGYGNLIVDPLTFPQLKEFGFPVVFDVTHSLQLPGSLGSHTGGRAQYVEPLALAGISQGIAGVFIECHPDPTRARCDGPSAMKLSKISRVLERLLALDTLVKSWNSTG